MTTLPESLRELSDERLMEQCRWEAFRASGPGGQKRNKTSSAVRIVHEGTGVAAIANESRSQAKNRQCALRRLRHRIALEIRHPLDLTTFQLPNYFLNAVGEKGRLNISRRSEFYLPVVGLVLDVLAAKGGSVSDAARLLGLSTGNLVQFLKDDSKLWAQVNRMRASAGLKPLVGR